MCVPEGLCLWGVGNTNIHLTCLATDPMLSRLHSASRKLSVGDGELTTFSFTQHSFFSSKRKIAQVS